MDHGAFVTTLERLEACQQPCLTISFWLYASVYVTQEACLCVSNSTSDMRLSNCWAPGKTARGVVGHDANDMHGGVPGANCSVVKDWLPVYHCS